ncbi:MAG: hypothetical protein ACF8MF_06860, partial [Phycisphaerales bacterium JB052]
AFAFHDEPTSEPDGTEAPAEPTTPAEPVDEPTTLTQEQVNRIVQERLQRERQQLQTQLANLGFEDGLEGLKAKLSQQREAEQRKLEEANQYKELYERIKAEKDQELQRKEQELQQVRTQHTQERINRELTSAAAGAINPDQVVALVRDKIKVSEDGTMYVVDEMGNRMTDGRGNMLTPRQYVATFLEQNPHFRPASAGRGGNSNPSGGGGPTPPAGGKVDLKRAKTDLAYFNQHREEIKRMIASGEISG